VDLKSELKIIEELKSKLRHVMDFPKEGIDFIDVTTVLQDGEAFRKALDLMIKKIDAFPEVDLVIAPESRGFIFGAPISFVKGIGFAPIRKPGKLPYKTVKIEYELEYGSGTLEMHADAVKPGQKVVIVDDLLATGGTIEANIKLVESLGGEVVGLLFFIELDFLKGREKLKNYRVESVVHL